MLFPCDTEGLATFDTFGLAIRSVNGGMHCAIVFDMVGGQPSLLHLESNYQLKAEAATPPYGWVEVGLETSNRKLMAIMADRVWRRRPAIPYGVSKLGVSFDAKTGDLRQAQLGRGLTCASFILAVFEAQGFKLLGEEGWPENANDEWQSWVVEMLRRGRAPPEQVDAVAQDIGSRRFHPTEVVASSTLSAEHFWPVPFEMARQVGAQLEICLTV